jgi:hypothetical protein
MFKTVDRRGEADLQRLQISSQSIGDKLKNLRRNKGEVSGLEEGGDI